MFWLTNIDFLAKTEDMLAICVSQMIIRLTNFLDTVMIIVFLLPKIDIDYIDRSRLYCFTN